MNLTTEGAHGRRTTTETPGLRMPSPNSEIESPIRQKMLFIIDVLNSDSRAQTPSKQTVRVDQADEEPPIKILTSNPQRHVALNEGRYVHCWLKGPGLDDIPQNSLLNIEETPPTSATDTETKKRFPQYKIEVLGLVSELLAKGVQIIELDTSISRIHLMPLSRVSVGMCLLEAPLLIDIPIYSILQITRVF